MSLIRGGGGGEARRSGRTFGLGLCILLALSLAVVLWIYPDYGVTWDEVAHISEGEKVLAYYQSGFDASFAQSPSPYGGLYDGSLALIPRLFPNGSAVELRHLLTALTAWLGVVGCARTAGLLGSTEAALYAALLMLTYPVYVGHGFANFADIPFAAGYIWSLYFLLRFVASLPKPSLATTLCLGTTIGLTAAVRVGGLMLIGILGLAVVLRFALRIEPRFRLPSALATLFRVSLVGGTAYGTMLALWPWAQGDPFVRPIQSLTIQPFWAGSVLFDGKLYEAAALPWYFTITQIAIQTPEIHLLLAGVGVFLLLRRANSTRSSPGSIAVATLLFSAVFPVAYAIARGARFFDSFRHFLFVVPPAVALLAVALQRLRFEHPQWRTPALVLLGLGVAFVAFDLVTLHPYQYVYYNRLVGGVAGAWDRYELDYWGASYKELLESLPEHLPQQGPLRLFADGPFNNVRPYLRSNMSLVWSPRDADYILTLTRSRAHLQWQGDEVARVARKGVPLSIALRARKSE